MLIGYARVSSNDQDTAAQVAALKAAKCERIYREQASGGRWDRPESDALNAWTDNCRRRIGRRESTPNSAETSTPDNGSCPILVMSRKAWRIPYISTRETRTVNREHRRRGLLSTASADDRRAAPHPLPRCATEILTMVDTPTAFVWTRATRPRFLRGPVTVHTDLAPVPAAYAGPTRSGGLGDPNAPAQTFGA